MTQHLAGALVLALFLSGCTLIESDEEAGNLELIGAWRLVYMDGGWGGGRHYPEPGEVIQLHLTDRSYYLLKKNDKSVAFGRYRVQHAESEALIRFEAKPADFCNPYSYRITGDTLSLRTKQCMDSFDPTYVRVR